jgi:DNA helicase-2/ATP-dependent DNA helicase PcrA
MTVHQAKGLEFPVVVIGAAMEKRFPSGFRKPKYPVPAELKISKNADDEEIHIRDERRLFYVGMTRAEDVLLIGSADKVNVRGSGRSRFIEEIEKDKIMQSVEAIKERPCRDEEKTRAPERKRLSYSGLHAYLLCPLQYKLVYECDFAVPQVYWAYFGGAVHSLLEHIHKQALEGRILQAKELPGIWETMWKPPESWDEKRRYTMGKTGLEYLKRYVSNYAERLKRIYWVEEQVEIPITETDILLTGRLDLACKSNGGIEIIDFKIRKRTGLEVMREELQVQIYALAATKIRMENVNGVILHLLGEDSGNEIQKYPWNDPAKESVEKTIQVAGEGIKKRKFDARPGMHCRFCDFRSLCPFSTAPAKKEEPDDEIALGAEAQKVS